MPKHRYYLEVGYPAGTWSRIPSGEVGLEYGRGYLALHRSASGPRVGMRLVRDDGRVMDEAPGLTEVSYVAPASVSHFWIFAASAAARCLRKAAEGARHNRDAEEHGTSARLSSLADAIEDVVRTVYPPETP